MSATTQREIPAGLPSRNVTVGHITDVHFPFHDEAKLREAQANVKGCDHIILGGDIMDCYTISRFDKDPRRKASLAIERAMTKAWLLELRNENPDARIDYIEGNHEKRLLLYVLRRAPELLELDLVTIPKLLNLDELDIHYHPQSGFRAYDLRFKHGDKVRAKAGYSAHAEMADHNCSGISGHTHRFAPAYRRTREGVLQQWWEGGGLFDIEQADYVESPDWVNGHLILHASPGGVAVEPVFL